MTNYVFNRIQIKKLFFFKWKFLHFTDSPLIGLSEAFCREDVRVFALPQTRQYGALQEEKSTFLLQ